MATRFGGSGNSRAARARLEEAVIAFHDALEEFTRERMPLDWAKTQNNLGLALTTLGEREGSTVRLEQAVVAFRQALEELTQEREPRLYSIVQRNLEIALKKQ